MAGAASESWRTIDDGDGSFPILVLAPADARAAVIFAVGSGGRPERHLAMLKVLADHGCLVAAPVFERLGAPAPTGRELDLRARRLGVALEALQAHALPLAGVGHSIGATALLILAGAEARTQDGSVVRSAYPRPLRKLALMAPPTQFFRPAGALDDVRAEIEVWAGEKDDVTPPGQVRFLAEALEGTASVRLHVIAGASHFSFMDAPPPHAAETLADREAFLRGLAARIGRYVAP